MLVAHDLRATQNKPGIGAFRICHFGEVFGTQERNSWEAMSSHGVGTIMPVTPVGYLLGGNAN